MDYDFGEGYPEDRNQPARLRVTAAVGVDAELVNLSNQIDAYVDRMSMRIERSNEDGASVSASFDLVFPNRVYTPIPTRRYLSIDDPDRANGLGGHAGLFSGEIISTSVKPDGDERVLQVRGSDWNDLLDKPPKQITVQWPPGDGTPVVDTTVELPLTAGTGVTVTPRSLRHIYPGKRLFAANSDLSDQEEIEVISVDYSAGTFTADFATDKLSTETQVQLSMHAKGLQEITPDSMTNINVGSLIYCYKTRGVTTQGNEWTVVESVTASTFTAYFNAWKTHDWMVRSEWRLFGGISDKELIADGFYMDLDTIDEVTGDIETQMVWIPSLLDEFYNDQGLQVFKNAVHELIKSLPHGKWENTNPREVLDWVVAQNTNTLLKPTYYMSFKQGTSTSMSILPPMLRYYDANNALLLAPVALTNSQLDYDEELAARWKEYTRSEDGMAFANKQTVTGSNGSLGFAIDQASVSDTGADNWVGRVIEAPVHVDTDLHTNEECRLRAEQLMAELRLSTRLRPLRVTTHAQLAPFVLYEPHQVSFDAIWEEGMPAEMEVLSVSLSFDSDGLAVYDFLLGERRTPWAPGQIRLPRNFRRANVLRGPRGKIQAVSAQVTSYVDTHMMVRGEADLYVAETSESPITMYLPRASHYPGLPVTIKVPDTATEPVTVLPYNRNGVTDSIDGQATMTLVPGQTVSLQSAGEYDKTGKGAPWHQTAGSSPGGTINIEHNYLMGIPSILPDQLRVTECTLTEWYVSADQIGSIEIDVLRNGVSITNGNPITLVSALTDSGTTAAWDTALLDLNENDIITFLPLSVTGITKVHISLGATKPMPGGGQTIINNGDIIGVTDHGDLTGLGGDDHPQYFNEPRGDARYSPLAHDHGADYAPISHTHSEAGLAFTDVTTNNSSTTKHGLLPKLSGDVDDVLRGDGTWGIGGGGGGATTLDDLGDVVIATPQAGDTIYFDGTQWVNGISLRRWEPLTNGDPLAPELIFDSNGDVVMVEVLP